MCIYDLDRVLTELHSMIDPNVDSETGEPCYNWVIEMRNETIGRCMEVVRSGRVAFGEAYPPDSGV